MRTELIRMMLAEINLYISTVDNISFSLHKGRLSGITFHLTYGSDGEHLQNCSTTQQMLGKIMNFPFSKLGNDRTDKMK